MKALTLTQPWATLIALGSKQYETRSWSPRYRGPLLIHAAKSYPRYAQDFASTEFTLGRLPGRIPRGALIAVVDLVDVEPTRDVAGQVSALERLYGDYGEGRFAWRLENVRLLHEPIPYRGALGLFTVPDGLVEVR